MSFRDARPCNLDRPDLLFHVTARVNWRFWLLVPDECAASFFEILAECAEEFSVELLGFVLMSNHFHFICQSPARDEFRRLTSYKTNCRHQRRWPKGHLKLSVIGQFMHKLMFRTSRRIQRRHGLSGHLWEGRYHARPLQDPADFVDALAYDHLNPVVQGMATLPGEYARSSAAWWHDQTPGQVPLLVGPPPFGLELTDLRRRVHAREDERAFREFVNEFASSGLDQDTAAGQQLFNDLLRELEASESADTGVRT